MKEHVNSLKDFEQSWKASKDPRLDFSLLPGKAGSVLTLILLPSSHYQSSFLAHSK